MRQRTDQGAKHEHHLLVGGEGTRISRIKRMIADRRDDMIARWEEIRPSHWAYVESPGTAVLAEVRVVDGCFWHALCADGATSRFRLCKRAIEWCEVHCLQAAILS